MISAVEIAWASGFLEGEAYFGFNRRKGPNTKSEYSGTVLVSVAQVQREPLERLQRLFGGRLALRTKHTYLTAEGRRIGQPVWSWLLHGSGAVALMMTVYTFMSPKRREKIAHSLECWRKAPGVKWRLGKWGTHCARGHLRSDENTYTAPGSGVRTCRLCHRVTGAAAMRRRRAAARAARLAQMVPA